MNNDVNKTQAPKLTEVQLEAALRIRRLMGEIGISMQEVRSYYRLHAPPPKQARRVLTIGQRVALNQIKLLVRRHKVTEEEIKRICQEVGGGESAETPQDDGLGTGFEGGDDGAVASKTDAMAAVASEVAPSSEEVIAEAQGSVGATANRETTPEVTKADQPQVLDTSVPGNLEETQQAAQEPAIKDGRSPKRPGDPGWVKYRHPDSGESWDGVGQKPGWLVKALLHDGMLLRDLLPIENFPLEEETAGLPAGVPFEELAERFNLRQAAPARSLADIA